MKKFNSFLFNTRCGVSEIKILLALALFLTVSSCTKRSEDTLNNIDAYRPDASQAQTIDYNIVSEPVTLKDRVNGVDYIISNELDISSGRLIIEPGVTLMFEEGAGILVNNGGGLTAIGSEGKEIYFISRSGKRGGWRGITFLSNSATNVLSYCVIKEGGQYSGANVTVGKGTDATSVEISHSTITTSYNTGILVSEGAQVHGFTGNTITTNTGYPVSVYASNTGFLAGNNTYTNNGKQYIELTGVNGSAPFTQPITLKNITQPYALSGNIVAGNAVTIEAGVRVYMNNGSQLIIDGFNGSGTFNAVGTAAQPIMLTSIYNTSGSWNAINFRGSSSALNRLEHCVISGGGSETGNHGMINLIGSSSAQSQVDIRNCNLSKSAANGIYIQKNNAKYNADIETVNTFANIAGSNVYYDVSIASGE